MTIKKEAAFIAAFIAAEMLLVFPGDIIGQVLNKSGFVRFQNVDPTDPCSNHNYIVWNIVNGFLSGCKAGTWVYVAGNTGPTGPAGTGSTGATGATGVTGATGSGASVTHVITYSFDGLGAVLTTGDSGRYPTARFACTITTYDASILPSGSLSVDIWKKAGAIPTSSDKISGSSPIDITSNVLVQSGSVSGWSPVSVATGDVFGASIASVTNATSGTIQIWCTP